MNLPPEVLEGVAGIIRQICLKENDYVFRSHQMIGDMRYKIVIRLEDIHPEKEAKTISIHLTREDE